jgi:hypothetical protein
MRASEHSKIPKELELFEMPAILEPFPQFAQLSQHRGAVVARPSIVSGEKYEDVSRAYIRSVHSVLTGENIPSVAAAKLEGELIELTGQKSHAVSGIGAFGQGAFVCDLIIHPKQLKERLHVNTPGAGDHAFRGTGARARNESGYERYRIVCSMSFVVGA